MAWRRLCRHIAEFWRLISQKQPLQMNEGETIRNKDLSVELWCKCEPGYTSNSSSPGAEVASQQELRTRGKLQHITLASSELFWTGQNATEWQATAKTNDARNNSMTVTVEMSAHNSKLFNTTIHNREFDDNSFRKKNNEGWHCGEIGYHMTKWYDNHFMW